MCVRRDIFNRKIDHRNLSSNSCPSRRMFVIAGRCRRSLPLQTVSRSLTDPKLISCDADSNSCSSTIRNSAMAMKSRRVLRGQPASRNAFAMLQLFSLRICSTLWYLVWIALHYRAILNCTFRWRILTHFRLMHRECSCAFKF